MKILITGATGLVGSRLLETLIIGGYDDIRVLTTNSKRATASIAFPVEIKEWKPEKGEIEKGSLDNIDIVFHIAGESIAEGRWNKNKKERILKSRTESTKLLLKEISNSKTTPKKFISSSAVGIYGNTEDEIITEDSPFGSDYLSDVCIQWEKELLDHSIDNMQAHTLRTGIVLSSNGGALIKMLPPFKVGFGGKLGSGKQYMSWIHIDDLVESFIFLMNNKLNGFSFNAVSPDPITNIQFTKILGKVLKRPTALPVPGFMLKIIFGEMSQILLEGQKVIPQRLIENGFKFKFQKLHTALDDILKYDNNGEILFHRYQWINKEREQVFSFFSEAKNLESITPKYLNFKVLGMNTDKIESGTLIHYKLKIHGVPARWKAQISNFIEGESFIDEQVKGPYKKWVHKHDFISVKSGTLISDKVVYKIPFGFLGRLVAGFFIKRDVNNIFNFRNKVIKDIF
jgi:uncharacterized protein (TIGR01777 family)